MNNLGGYDENSFNERIGVSYLEQLLLRSFRIIPYFSVNDKTPNLDGWFEICDRRVQKGKKGIPMCRFSAQIKTLNTDYCNKNKDANTGSQYKYPCDTKVVNAALNNISLDPIILFLVDWREKKVFWKYLSISYCLSLNVKEKKSKTIFFSETDLIGNTDDWIDELVNINSLHIKKKFDKFDNIYMISDMSEAIPESVTEAYSYLNSTMEHGLNFIKKEMFPDVWKFGIAYLQDESSFYQAGIYRVSIGQNQMVKKDFDIEDESLISFTYGKNIDLKKVAKDYMVHFVDLFFAKGSMVMLIKYIPELALQEIIFNELDEALVDNYTLKGKKVCEGDLIYLGIKNDKLSIKEYYEMKREHKTTDLADKCMEELKKRGRTEIERVWKACRTAKVKQWKVQKIDKDNFLNKEALDIQDEIKVANYKVCQDEKQILHENFILLVQNIQLFYDESCKQFGPEFYDYIGKTKKYLVELNESLSTQEVKDSQNFIFKGNSSSKVNSTSAERIDLQYIQFSWEKLWRVMFRNMVSQYLEINNCFLLDYLASK